MNKEQMEGKWEQLKGSMKKTWGKLTDDDFMLYEGEREKFFGKVKELHGESREAAEKKIEEMQRAYERDNRAA